MRRAWTIRIARRGRRNSRRRKRHRRTGLRRNALRSAVSRRAVWRRRVLRLPIRRRIVLRRRAGWRRSGLRLAVSRLAIWRKSLLRRSILRRRQRLRLNHRPVLWPRPLGDRAWRTQRLVVVAERAAFAQLRNLERIIDAASARPVDCRDAHPSRRLLRNAGIDAGKLGLMPPRIALGEQIMTAAGDGDQGDEDGEADERPADSRRHKRRMPGIPLRTLQRFARSAPSIALTMRTNSFPGRSAARSGALQTRDRNRCRVWYDPGTAVHRFTLHRIRETRLVVALMHSEAEEGAFGKSACSRAPDAFGARSRPADRGG